jgi:hypothetical protein
MQTDTTNRYNLEFSFMSDVECDISGIAFNTMSRAAGKINEIEVYLYYNPNQVTLLTLLKYNLTIVDSVIPMNAIKEEDYINPRASDWDGKNDFESLEKFTYYCNVLLDKYKQKIEKV